MSTVQDEIDTSEPPVSVPDTGDTGESGKLKMIVSLVKKCFGVKDIASMYVLHLFFLLGAAKRVGALAACGRTRHTAVRKPPSGGTHNAVPLPTTGCVRC